MATIPTDITTPTVPDPPVMRAEWTVAALLDQLGGIPPERVLMKPCPGTATENDILEMDDRGGPLCELIDGTLVEKTRGFYHVWYVYSESRSAIVYTSPEQSTEIGSDGMLSGGDVLRGFELPLQRLFSESEKV